MLNRRRGFTLIELMIVVAIIGILAAIAVPKFAELIRKSQEGKVKGTLGAMRSAIMIYYGDMEGAYPSDLNSLTISGKYLPTIASVKTPDYHAATTVIRHNASPNGMGCGSGYILDTGEWIYWSDAGSLCGSSPPPAGQRAHVQGDFWVACSHTDTKGSLWTTY
ncbi:MAG: prepilin-type N-terminal cleavage/methylation domain-containing protein [Elusimicrobia bacterium]|nr:prepilin-type N-terminal cleavage/methylation domain-containing protein [Elusimicrobiota bacterium]